jgi:hypothetical protein
MTVTVNGSTNTITGVANMSAIAGTATVAPITLTSGTNLTSASAGNVEYDGTVFYATPATTQRSVIMTEQMIILSATYTLTSQTAAQKLFNATTNGAVSITAGAYEFECNFALTGLSAVNGQFGFALGGTATFTQGYTSVATVAATSLATATASVISFSSAANVAIATTGTGTFGTAQINGIIRCTVAGTIIPSVSLNTAAAAVVQTNSFFRLRPIGASNVTNTGAWS